MKDMIKTFALAAIAALALTGCIKHEPIGHRPYPDDGGGSGHGGSVPTEDKLVLKERTDWKATYLGRTQNMEQFQFTYTGTLYVFPLIISPDDLKNVYANDLLEFFKYEDNLLQQDLKANPTKPLSDLGVYGPREKDAFFGRHLHGTWLLYLVELNANYELTGQYAEYAFTIQEEQPTEAYNRWIGGYTVTDGRYGTFEIQVSQAEANYLYYVDGWEKGRSVSQQMDGERDWIYARFDGDRLVFYAQFLQTEDYEGSTVDEVFAGTYLSASSDNIGDLDWEGVDYEDNVAYTAYENENLVLRPWTIELDNGYTFTYSSMRYSRLWFTENGTIANWAFYNSVGVPMLPATMTFIPGTRASASAPAVRQRSKGTVHRDQLKPVQTVRQRRAMSKG